MTNRTRAFCALALLLIAGGGALGWIFAPAPLYRSEGTFYVSPWMLSLDSPNGMIPLPDHEQFMGVCQSLLESHECTEMAMQHPGWVALGMGFSQRAKDHFMSCIQVTLGKGEPILRVSFSHEDPQAAFSGVNALMTAFEKRRREKALTPLDSLIQEGAQEVKRRAETCRSLNDRIIALTSGYAGERGMAHAQDRLAAEMADLGRVWDAARTTIRDAERAIELARKQGRAVDTENGTEIAEPRLAREQLGEIERRRKETEEASRSLLTQLARVEMLANERDRAEQSLWKLRENLERMESVADRQGRITMISCGALPTSPAQDHRFGYAILGAGLGLLAFVVLRLRLH